MKQMNYKKLIIPNIPYVFFVYLFDKVGQAARLAPGADISEKIKNCSAALPLCLPPLYSWAAFLLPLLRAAVM